MSELGRIDPDLLLYKYVDNYTKKCQICGKEIKFDPHGYGAKSHARKHIREGKAKEIRIPSTRCYAGYDIEFIIVKENVKNGKD